MVFALRVEEVIKMNGCDCMIYKMILDTVSNDYVAWAFMTLTKAYKYAGLLV